MSTHAELSEGHGATPTVRTGWRRPAADIDWLEGWDSEESPRGILDYVRALDRGVLPSSDREVFLVGTGSPTDEIESSAQPYFFADTPTLCAELANLEPNPDSVRGFALKYGPLGYPAAFVPTGTVGARHRHGEPLSVWLEATGVLRVIWREVHGTPQRDGEAFGLAGERTVVVGADSPHREYSARVQFLGRRACSVLPKSPTHVSVLVPESSDEVERAEARSIAIARVVSVYLNTLVRGALVPGASVDALPNLVLEPITLLGAAWLQLATDLAEGSAKYGTCIVCGSWFKTTRGRSDRVYCGSSTCRGRVFRTKRDRCLELAAEGIGVLEVAKVMSAEFSEPITAQRVLNWIDGAK